MSEEITITRDGVTYQAVQCRFRADGCTAVSSDRESMEAHEGRHELRRYYIKSFGKDNYHFLNGVKGGTREQRAMRKEERAKARAAKKKNLVRYCQHPDDNTGKKCGREVYSLKMCRFHYYNGMKTGKWSSDGMEI